MADSIRLVPGEITLGELRSIRDGRAAILCPSAYQRIDAAADAVSRVVATGRTVYGVNTGFGRLARTSIKPEQLVELQRNLILSHCAGTGPLIEERVVRLILALKAASFGRGHSGVRRQVVDALLALLNHDVYPCIPSKGSVGASGDLAPLAHLAAGLMGIGEMRHKGSFVSADDGLALANLKPLIFGPKEGLALLNGTQVSTAFALDGLFAIENVFAAAVVGGALSTDAAQGSVIPFDPRIQEVRTQLGQMMVAEVYSDLLAGSRINESHIDCTRVQDPYSLRCQPQVMGACLDHVRFAAEIFAREANAVSDNPLVFASDEEILSGGNFHAEPIAMAADVLALAIAEIGALAERRIALLMDPALSSLPPFLAVEPGLNSGFMIAQVTAAALASENKSLSHPASVDSLPTSANQEDHVSMATFAARRLREMAENSAGIVAIELLAACQGIDFHAPLQSSEKLERVKSMVRAKVPQMVQDRYLATDIELLKTSAIDGEFSSFAERLLPSWNESTRPSHP